MSFHGTFAQAYNAHQQPDASSTSVPGSASWTHGSHMYDAAPYRSMSAGSSNPCFPPGYGRTVTHVKPEPDADYSSLIRALAPLASQALNSNFAAPHSATSSSDSPTPRLQRPDWGSRVSSPLGSTDSFESYQSPPYVDPSQLPEYLSSNAPYDQMWQFPPDFSEEGVEYNQHRVAYQMPLTFGHRPMYSPPSSESSRQGSPNPPDSSAASNRLPCLSPGCTRTFKREYTRSVHMSTHKPRERQRFRCTVPPCLEEFSRRHDRFRHECHIHGVESEWKCDTCGKFFAKEITLAKHVCPSKRQDTW